MTPWKAPETPAEKVTAAVGVMGAHPANADPENAPAPEGPYSPWSAPVMLIAGRALDGSPWLWLACRCGWFLGYSPQYDPGALAEVAHFHQGRCEVAQALLTAGKAEDGTADPGELIDLLSLVGVTVTPADVDRWTAGQREAARDWAAREHLHASDNPVERKPKPQFLAEVTP